MALIDGWLTLAGSRPALVAGIDGRPRLSERSAVDSPRRALGMVAYDAARMLGLPAERARVRICGSDTCSARFYDRSPAAARRWCSMAVCGNQAKARASGRGDEGVRLRPVTRAAWKMSSRSTRAIAEPDRDGGALRYRGVDLEDLAGVVPFERVWGLLVDGALEPASRRPSRTRCACAHPIRASTCRRRWRCSGPSGGCAR